VAKNEKQAALSDFFTKLSHSLPLADFYTQVIPTDSMKQAVACIYIEVIDLIERATKYYCLGALSKTSAQYFMESKLKYNGIIGKLSDAILQPIEYRFEMYICNIESSKQRMFELRDAAHAARQADMQYTLDNTNQGLIVLNMQFSS
jgi:hypothetical protein